LISSPSFACRRSSRPSAGQALQAQIEDGAGLLVGEADGAGR
jgi:hypothetical protein